MRKRKTNDKAPKEIITNEISYFEPEKKDPDENPEQKVKEPDKLSDRESKINETVKATNQELEAKVEIIIMLTYSI